VFTAATVTADKMTASIVTIAVSLAGSRQFLKKGNERRAIIATFALSNILPNSMSQAFQSSTPCSQNNKTYTEAWLVLSFDPIDRKHAST
jgi:hypothetical protein